jgi:hypothetical protein
MLAARLSSFAALPTMVGRRSAASVFAPLDTFARRHIGPQEGKDIPTMLKFIGVKTVDELIKQTVPAHIRWYV